MKIDSEEHWRWDIRERLELKQIEDFVIPLTRLKLPDMHNYLIRLVNDAYKTQYISIESI